ncbi:MAG TPA: hypothetical protein VGM37_00240 [Armatimonadota bacterium]|jgi:hypothetical protein
MVVLLVVFGGARLQYHAVKVRERRPCSGGEWEASGAGLREKAALIAPGMAPAMGLVSIRPHADATMSYLSLAGALGIIYIALAPQRLFVSAPEGSKAVRR